MSLEGSAADNVRLGTYNGVTGKITEGAGDVVIETAKNEVRAVDTGVTKIKQY